MEDIRLVLYQGTFGQWGDLISASERDIPSTATLQNIVWCDSTLPLKNNLQDRMSGMSCWKKPRITEDFTNKAMIGSKFVFLIIYDLTYAHLTFS